MESQKAPAVPVPYFLNEIIMKITKIVTDDLQTYRVYYTHSKNITRIIETWRSDFAEVDCERLTFFFWYVLKFAHVFLKRGAGSFHGFSVPNHKQVVPRVSGPCKGWPDWKSLLAWHWNMLMKRYISIWSHWHLNFFQTNPAFFCDPWEWILWSCPAIYLSHYHSIRGSWGH